MTSMSFDISNLRSRLKRLSHQRQLAYGIWQLERMEPNLLQFCAETAHKSMRLARVTLLNAWVALEDHAGKIKYLVSDQEFDLNLPDTEAQSSLYTSSALDCLNAAWNLMSFIQNDDVELIVEMSSLARDSADIYIQLSENLEDEGEDFEAAIQDHPLMQLELRRQNDDLGFLERLKSDDSAIYTHSIQRSLLKQYGAKWL